MSTIGDSASHLYTAILSADSAAALDQAADQWLNDHIANEIVSMQFTPDGGGFHLLIVYKGKRRVRRA